jgi:hypothetical protein
MQRPDAAEYFSGNKLLPGCDPAAHCYCGTTLLFLFINIYTIKFNLDLFIYFPKVINLAIFQDS